MEGSYGPIKARHTRTFGYRMLLEDLRQGKCHVLEEHESHDVGDFEFFGWWNYSLSRQNSLPGFTWTNFGKA